MFRCKENAKKNIPESSFKEPPWATSSLNTKKREIIIMKRKKKKNHYSYINLPQTGNKKIDFKTSF